MPAPNFDIIAERIIRKEGIAFVESALNAIDLSHAKALRIKDARETLKKAIVDALEEAASRGPTKGTILSGK